MVNSFIRRWFFSTNHKDIGVLYIIFGMFSGIIAMTISVVMRMELAHPGNQYLEGNHQLYNVLITAHGLINDIYACYACPSWWFW
jgi:heme/copper-type cytochrome/quinol oxidase subunit 1